MAILLRITAALALVVSLSPAAVWAQSTNCDSVLASQISTQRLDHSSFLSWLQIIDEEAFNKIKHEAGGSAYGGYFSGSYDDFKEKRQSFRSESSLNISTQDSSETYKKYLNDSQINTWLQCVGGKNELGIFYRNPDSKGATVVVFWDSSDLVGKIRGAKVSFSGADGDQVIDLGDFEGRKEFIVTRTDDTHAIRGVVSGTAGVSGTSFAASFYLAPAPPAVTVPEKLVVTKVGVEYQTRALWSHGKRSQTFTCERADPGYDLLVIQTKEVATPGRGRCAVAPYCDSHGESCHGIVITRGCAINRSWHDWYKEEVALRGLPYTPEAACQLSTDF